MNRIEKMEKDNQDEMRLADGLPVLTPGLHLVIGRPGSGKTALLARAYCDMVFVRGRSVIFNSLDVEEREMLRKIGELDMVRTGELIEAWRVFGGLISERKLEGLAERCHPLTELVMVDTLHLLALPLWQMWGVKDVFARPQTALKIRGLATLAKMLGIPIVATAHLERFGDHLLECDDDSPLDCAETVVKLSKNERGESVREVVKGNV